MIIRNSHVFRLAVSRPHRRTRSTAGVTTKNIALGLGIIGVVLAAVWLASSSIDFRSNSDRATDGLNSARSASSKPLNPAPPLNPVPLAVPSAAGADFCYYTPTMLDKSVFPANMLWPDPPATRYSFHPFDANHTMSCGGTVGSAQVSLACGTTGGVCDATKPVLFAVRYTNIANTNGRNPCSDLLLGKSVLGAARSLSQIVVTWSAGPQTTYSGDGSTCSAGKTCPLPVTASTASTGCNSGNPGTETLTIDWYYELGG